MTLLIVVPTLNEAAHIAEVIATLLQDTPEGTRLAVADGGSRDGTRAIVEGLARTDPRIRLVDNPDRLQSAGINRAVALCGEGCSHLLRADAHAGYPPGFARLLLDEMERTGAVSVTVAMETVADSAFTEAVAAAQNSLLGTGGSAHRIGAGGRFVDHGHHALMRLDAFRAVGGYDPGQSHNEDAELDHRLTRSGGRIWLTDRVRIRYMPRRSFGALFRQYRAHGRGRAMTVAKHGLRLKPRQIAPALVPPAVMAGLAGLALSPLSAGWLILAGPATVWALLCLGFGALLALRARRWPVLLSGPVAMTMHFGWGTGFLLQRLRPRRQSAARGQQMQAGSQR
jgi:succinoglycan biosynthesis protein ExoA